MQSSMKSLSKIIVFMCPAVEYAKTTDYHWPVVSAENTNVLVGRVGQVIPGPVPIGKGPWGFEEATKITDDQVTGPCDASLWNQ